MNKMFVPDLHISQLYLDYVSFLIHWGAASGLLIALALAMEPFMSSNNIKSRMMLWKITLIAVFIFPFLYVFMDQKYHLSLAVKDLLTHLSLLGVFLWIYAIGFSVKAARFILQFNDQRSFINSSKICHAKWVKRIIADLSNTLKLNRDIQVRIMPYSYSPFVTGCLQPVIILPEYVLEHFTRSEVRMILAHELSHIRNHDFVYDRIITGFQIVLWFFPGWHFVKRRIERHRELVCDMDAIAVCRQPTAYANMFVHLAEMLQPQQPLECDLYFMKKGQKTLERFDHILRFNHQKPEKSSPSQQAILVTTVSIFVFLLSSVQISLTQQVNTHQVEFPRLEDIDTTVLEVEIIDNAFPSLPAPEPLHIQSNILPELAADALQVRDVYWIVDQPAGILFGYAITNHGAAQEPVSQLELTPLVAALAGGRETPPRTFSLHASKDSFLFLSSIDRHAITADNPLPLGGIHIVDVSNPAEPELVTQFPAYSVGGINLIGNTLFARVTEFDGYDFLDYFTAFDVSNPAQIQEKWRVRLPQNEFIFSADVHPSDPTILYTGGKDIFVYRQTNEEITLLSRWEFENRNFSILYLNAFEDGLFCVTQSNPQNGLNSVNDPQTIEHRWIPLISNETAKSMVSLPFPNQSLERKVHANTYVYEPYFLTVINGSKTRGGLFISKLDSKAKLVPEANLPLGIGVFPTAYVNQDLWIGGDPLFVFVLQSFIPASSIYSWQMLEKYDAD